MRHMRTVTVAKASAKQDDVGAYLFMQVFFAVASIMLSAALGDK